MTNKINERIVEIKTFCEKNSDPGVVKKYSRYFNEGYDAYGVSRKIFDEQVKKYFNLWKKDMDINDFLLMGERLIVSGKYEEAGFAILFASFLKKDYNKEMFERFGSWLENGICNWAHTDILSTKIIPVFILNNLVEPTELSRWIKSKSVWKRRAVPVSLLVPLKKNLSPDMILTIIEPLMTDDEKKVQQGLGWLLRETWKLYPGETEKFLTKHKDSCGRIIIQYATEKMDKEHKEKFRRTKRK